MLTVRLRGKTYHIRGTVAYGNQKVAVTERSTGIDKKSEATKYAKTVELDIIERLKRGKTKSPSEILFSQCVATYTREKGKSLSPAAVDKLDRILSRFGNIYVSDLKLEWNLYCAEKKDLKINSLARDLRAIMAAVNYAAKVMEFHAPEITAETENDEVTVLLDDDVREKLLKCYSKHATPIFETYAYTGMRTQECLQTDFENVSLDRRTIFIPKSKNDKPREIPMHDRVYEIIKAIWEKRGRPTRGRVFLNQFGQPYTDTRLTGQGGNPVHKAHLNAVLKLKKDHGIDLYNSDGKLTFTVHGWRHDWAGRMLMAGVDILTVQRIGGWSSTDMLKRYAALSKKHEQDAINKL